MPPRSANTGIAGCVTGTSPRWNARGDLIKVGVRLFIPLVVQAHSYSPPKTGQLIMFRGVISVKQKSPHRNALPHPEKSTLGLTFGEEVFASPKVDIARRSQFMARMEVAASEFLTVARTEGARRMRWPFWQGAVPAYF